MDKDENKISSIDVLETTERILEQHGKSDKEIKEMLEYHFPISSAIVQKILEARNRRKK